MLKYYNKYTDTKILFNDFFWLNQNASYYERVSMETHHLLKDSIFSFCPKGHGPSSLRLIQSIAYGAIPVLMDDVSTPFGDSLDFAVKFTFPHQNMSLPLTAACEKKLDHLYHRLSKIASSPALLSYHRQKMADFYINYLAVDLKRTHLHDLNRLKHMPFSDYIFTELDKHFK